MVDRHVVKMVLETAQLLSTAHRVLDGIESIDATGPRKKKVYTLHDDRDTTLYNATHVNHPSAVWVRQSVENYNWLVDHFFALGSEYTFRYGKKHLSITKLGVQVASPPLNLKEWDWTLMPSCMDNQYIIGDDPIANYRSYYVKGKSHLKKYTKRDLPYWWSQYE